MAQTPNIGWKFYYHYFQKIDFSYLRVEKEDGKSSDAPDDVVNLLKSNNQSIIDLNLGSYNTGYWKIPEIAVTPHGFELTTIYPGLLIGSGYQHEVKILEELKLGFFFDHTSGLPIIPGSSVKGALRSVFPFNKKENEKENFREFIRELLFEVSENGDDYKNVNVECLELSMFEGVDIDETIRVHGTDSWKEKKNWKYLMSPAKDVFYDAVIVKSEHPYPDGGKGKFLSNDYITPHINRENRALSPFTNPTPLQFLKVLPEVTFYFQFKLGKSQINGTIIETEEKISLFRQILLTLGIGAKTNVGYGQFKETE